MAVNSTLCFAFDKETEQLSGLGTRLRTELFCFSKLSGLCALLPFSRQIPSGVKRTWCEAPTNVDDKNARNCTSTSPIRLQGLGAQLRMGSLYRQPVKVPDCLELSRSAVQRYNSYPANHTLCFPASSYDIFVNCSWVATQWQYTVHIYTQTIYRTKQNKQYVEQHNNFWKRAGRAPSLRVLPWHLPYN